jgi:hypothetical protein
MTPLVSMRRALADPHLLGAALGGPSWLAWRILSPQWVKRSTRTSDPSSGK